METITVPQPDFSLTYNGKNISADLRPYLIGITYTDVIEDGSDSIDITVEDKGGKWIDAWYPELGAGLTLSIGYTGAPLTPCGDFEIDEIEIDYPPSTVKIKALATGMSRAHRTHRGAAYDKTTLRGIAEEIAGRHGLTIVGKIEAIPINRVTQAREKDLTFLKRLANEYGYGFSVKGDKLVFISRTELKGAAAVSAIVLTGGNGVIAWSLKDKIKDIVKEAEVGRHNRRKRKTTKGKAEAAAGCPTSKDGLKLNTRAENEDQAKRKAKAALDKKNDEKTTGSISLIGNPKLLAGLNITLTAAGKLAGKWQIKQSTHKIDRSTGYTTNIDVFKID